MRVCPECGTKTEAKVCPNDGLRTIREAVLTRTDAMIGRTVAGRYTVEDAIGKGGMGAVYKARHEETGGLVALKVLHRDRADSAEAIKRFHLEAQNAAVLRHSNTVRILDFGVDEDLLYLVMEHLHGETLSDRLKRVGSLSWMDAALIARQVLSALWEAHEHERRIVHRDIKPANIFLVAQAGMEDIAKVLDFGVARSLEGTGAGTQGMIGTPKAMAPEQWRGERVDARADLYSVGCVLYEMLAGRPPFVADRSLPTSDQILRMAHAHAHELPQPLDRLLAPSVPKGLIRLTHLLLEKDPERRPASARVTVELLDRALDGDPLASGAQPLSELDTLDGDTGEVAVSQRRITGGGRRTWKSQVIAPAGAAHGDHEAGTLDATGAPADLPRAWDAPAPRGKPRGQRETMFMTMDGGPVGAAEETIAPAGGEAQPYVAPSVPGLSVVTSEERPHPVPDEPVVHVDAAVDPSVAWAPTTARSVTAPSDAFVPGDAFMPGDALMPGDGGPGSHREMARSSGGWGDELWGDAGRSDPPAGAPRPDSGLHVVTSEARPHAIPETPVVPEVSLPPKQLPKRQRKQRDGRGMVARVLVLSLVGSALYFGGTKAWERIQARPPNAPVADAAMDVPPPPVRGVATLDEEEESGAAVAAGPELVYRARLSRADHKDAKGRKLKRPWQVVVRDRERVHTGHKDTGDQGDERFKTRKARAELEQRLRARRLPDDVRRAIAKGTPLVEVQVFPDEITIRVVKK